MHVSLAEGLRFVRTLEQRLAPPRLGCVWGVDVTGVENTIPTEREACLGIIPPGNNPAVTALDIDLEESGIGGVNLASMA